MTTDLKRRFRRAQNGYQEDFEIIVDKFQPLIKKYAGKLEQEDAFNELMLFLCQFVQKVELDKFECDAQLKAYLNKSIKCEANRLLKLENLKQSKEVLIEDNKDGGIYIYHSIFDEVINKLWAIDTLTKKEYQLLYLHYAMGYSVAEIAAIYHVSRQAINQMKNRALKKVLTELFNSS